MALKDETKVVVHQLIGPLNAAKVDNLDESDPQAFLDQSKELISALLGDTVAQAKLQPLYDKYVKK